MSLNYSKYLEKYFKYENPIERRLNILISGSFTIKDSSESAKEFLISEDNYLFQEDGWGDLKEKCILSSKEGSLDVVGLLVPILDSNGIDRSIKIKACTVVILYVHGSRIVLNVLSKEILGQYAYLKTTAEEISGVDELTISSAKAFKNYFICYSSSLGETVRVSFQPDFDWTYDNYDGNPIINNLIYNRTGSYAHYLQVTVSESGSETFSSGSYIDIADSFYTEISNISPRYLGSKVGYTNVYVGNKQRYTSASIAAFRQSEEINNLTGSALEPAFGTFNVFSGSVYASGTSDQALRDMANSEMVFEQLRFAPTYSITQVDSTSSTPYISRIDKDSPEKYQHELPTLGDIIYRLNIEGAMQQRRVPDAEIYSREKGAKLLTNRLGIVYNIVPIRYDITGSGEITGSVELDDVLIKGNLRVLGSASVSEPYNFGM